MDDSDKMPKNSEENRVRSANTRLVLLLVLVAVLFYVGTLLKFGS